jgi:hypothetical protein
MPQMRVLASLDHLCDILVLYHPITTPHSLLHPDPHCVAVLLLSTLGFSPGITKPLLTPPLTFLQSPKSLSAVHVSTPTHGCTL